MNSNPYAVPAIVACALMLIACITGLYWVSSAQRPAGGRHARPHHGKHEPGNTAGTGEPDWLDEDEADIGWWAGQPPQPGAVEIITGPGTRIAATSELTLGVLERVRDSLAALGTAQPAGDPEATGEIPHAVGTWGKTPAEVAAELAAKYLAAPQ